jgi:uncharacterized protein with HEPN domain
VSLKNWRIRLQHIIENVERIQDFVSGMSYELFCADTRTSFAVAACFTIIGEAARLIPLDVRQANPSIPWSKMVRMRNFVVHQYDVIDLEVVWKTIAEDFPELLPQLRELMEATKPDS